MFTNADKYAPIQIFFTLFTTSDKYVLKSGYLAVFTANLLIFVRNGEQGAKYMNGTKTTLKPRPPNVQNSRNRGAMFTNADKYAPIQTFCLLFTTWTNMY